MKEISIKVDDELYRRASRAVEDLEAEVNQHVNEYLESLNGDDDGICVPVLTWPNSFKRLGTLAWV